MIKLTLINPWDRDEAVRLNLSGIDTKGKQVDVQLGYADYDRYGSMGQELLRDLGRDLAKTLERLGVDIEFEENEEVEGDED